MVAIDQRIISVLRTDGRITNANLAEKVGLSPSACLCRVRLLEESGTIRGYFALINDRAAASETAVIVQITLERQTDKYLRRFEKAACQCPDMRLAAVAEQLGVRFRYSTSVQKILTEGGRIAGVARSATPAPQAIAGNVSRFGRP